MSADIAEPAEPAEAAETPEASSEASRTSGTSGGATTGHRSHADPSGGHPLPQLRRSHWCSLDGPWGFAYDEAEAGLDRDWPSHGVGERTITVPFPPESGLSGIGETDYHPVVWYSRAITADDLTRAGRPAQGERILLHFGAVDYRASVWIDGQLVGEHEGGHVPFALDITRALPGDGEDALLVVRAEDRPLDAGQPRGKQDWRPEPHSIWYSRTTGIWQSVWLEAVPRTAIAELAWTPSRACDAVELEVTTTRPVPEGSRITARLTFEGRPLAEVTARLPETTTTRLTVDLRQQVHGQHYERLLWSPEHPRLINAEVMLSPAKAPLAGGTTAAGAGGTMPDVVASYLGLRTVGAEHRRFLLNGRPYYVRGVLEQGFWPDSHLAAPDDGARRDEVALIKELGFNATRVHQKVEDPRFLYWADRLGLLVWGEMPAPYEFTTQAITRLVAEWGAAVRRDRSHPSVVTWVPINESWGVQHLAERPEQRALSRALADLTRAIDPSRPVISNDGWEHTCSDMISIHDYDADDLAVTLRYSEADRLSAVLDGLGPSGRRITVQGAVDRELPVMVTEFGGIRYIPGDDDADGGGSGGGSKSKAVEAGETIKTSEAVETIKNAVEAVAAAKTDTKAGSRAAESADEAEDEQEATWGYTTAAGPEDFEARLRRAFGALQASPHLAGFCYTQLTDTMQEANGLVDARRRPKIAAKVIREIVKAPITS